jgi:hypothetical protein
LVTTLVSALAARWLPVIQRGAPAKTTQYVDLQGVLTGATGLDPATSGVTGRIGYGDAQQRTALNDVICRVFGAPGAAVPHGCVDPRIGVWATSGPRETLAAERRSTSYDEDACVAA